MTSKLPPRIKVQASPKVPQASAHKTPPPLDATLLLTKRRSGLRAVGVAVIVAVGAILGAQWKSAQQSRERLGEAQLDRVEPVLTSKAAAGNAAAVPTGVAQEVASNNEKTKAKLDSRSGRDPANSTSNFSTDGRGTTYDQRQITYLEDRRGVLMTQKFELERKIERVREKRRREDELEERRKAANASDNR